MESNYIRNDIYYCSDCGQFYKELTDQQVEVPYSEMPAEFALKVMNHRKRPSNRCHGIKRKPKPKQQGKGFG